MLELPHAAIGAVIATKIPNPIVSVPLALLSHFAMDYVPHWNPSIYTETKKYGKPNRKSNLIVIADIILTALFGLFLINRFWADAKLILIILLTSFSAILPDFIEGFYFYLGIKSKALEKLIKFQHEHQFNVSLVPGILSQIVVLAVCLYLLLST